MPHDEGNKMTMGQPVPCMRARIAAVAIAGAIASMTVSGDGHAQASLRERRGTHQFHPYSHRYLPADSAAHTAPASTPPAPMVRTASMPGEFGDHQRDGHMTPDERRLLRQHIEDAVRELYKR